MLLVPAGASHSGGIGARVHTDAPLTGALLRVGVVLRATGGTAAARHTQ